MKKYAILIVVICCSMLLTGCGKYSRFNTQAMKLPLENTNYIFYSEKYWTKENNTIEVLDLVKAQMRKDGIRRNQNQIIKSSVFGQTMLFTYCYKSQKEIGYYAIGTMDIVTKEISFGYFYNQKQYTEANHIVFFNTDTILIRSDNQTTVYSLSQKEILETIAVSDSTYILKDIENDSRFGFVDQGVLTIYTIADSALEKEEYLAPSNVTGYGHLYQHYLYNNQHYFNLMTQTYDPPEIIPQEESEDVIWVNNDKCTVIRSMGEEQKKLQSIMIQNGNEEIIKEITMEGLTSLSNKTLINLQMLADKYEVQLELKEFTIVNNTLIVMIADPGVAFFLASRSTFQFAFTYDIELDEIEYIGYRIQRQSIYDNS